MNRSSQVIRTHRYASALKPSNPVYARAVLNCLLEPLLADLSEGGDVTTDAVFVSRRNIRAILVSKQIGILAGMQELVFFLGKQWLKSGKHELFRNVQLVRALKDGSRLRQGSVIAELQGDVHDILKLERTLLNFLQHMSGVATATSIYVKKCGKSPVLVCPTRKTPWGLLDKRACFVGGAGTHRLNLSDAILVKDTHLDLLGHDFRALGKKLGSAANLRRFVEVEVESPDDARNAATMFVELQQRRAVPCFIMLDNMHYADIAKFVRELRSSKRFRNIFVEASGGINLKNILHFAKTGADIISVGAMTHSAPALDISLKIKPARS